jgi:hypothetical protein
MRTWPVILMASVAVAANVSNPASQEDKTIYDEDVQLVYAAPMESPSGVLSAFPGAVVVRVTLGHDGHVTAALPVSGLDRLIPACLANAKNWVFKPNRAKSAIIVYEFRMGEGVCPSGSYNMIRPPNLSQVGVCYPQMNVSTSETKR